MLVKIQEKYLDQWEILSKYSLNTSVNGKYGATSVFVGTMRDFNQGDIVQSMRLEYYPGMTERYLEKICEIAEQRWPLLDTLIVHRVGEIKPTESIVLVAVWSSHRKEAFEASQFMMEELKSSAPFWKKEKLQNGERWVEKHTPG